ncbi:TNF receptor-associated factor 3-like [Amphiura filiformis]|uniref:TNF receptor-associated factor 3-like n=1 Tax=Amphiura filiformis TaxID=82378 RepID=UPI003B21B690
MAMSRLGSLQSTESGSSYSSSLSSPPPSLLQMKGYLIFIFKKDVDKQFLCKLCELVLRWPMQTTCGCRFCFGCIYNFICDKKGDLTCPSCEDTFNTSEITRDHYSRKQVEKMIVFCSNKKTGCPAEMILKDLDVHLESCVFQPIECLHKLQGCTAVVIRGQLADHLQKECLFRSTTCDYCGEEFPIIDIKTHQEKCKESTIECPLKCTSKGIHKDKMKEHLEKYCPLVLVVCIYETYGCKFQDIRREMEVHIREAQPDHLQLTTKWLEETLLKVTQTQHLVQELTNNKDIMENKLESLTTEFSNIQIATKKNEGHTRELQKIAAKQSDQIDVVQEQVSKCATKEDVVEIKKSFVKPIQDKQDQIDDRLKRLERGGARGGGFESESHQGRNASAAGGVSNARMISVENQVGMHSVRLAEQDIRFQVLETANYDGVLVWKIKDFDRRKRDADSGKTLSLYSQPFYSSRYGYKMCARIYLNGDGMGKGTHISLFFVVMRGDYDALLPWPFRQKVTLMLLDQQTGRRHLSDSFRPDPKSSSFQRPTTEMNIASGCPLFVNQNVLKDSAYIKDDVIFIKVIVDTSDLYGP